jgi:hypothetical protein
MPKVTFPSDAAEQIVERLEAALGDRQVHLQPGEKAKLQLDIEDAIQKWGAYITRVVAEAFNLRDRK